MTTTKPRTITGLACPACSGRKHKQHEAGPSIYVCARCGAVHGSCYKGTSYSLVLPYWHEGESFPEDERYFDLEVLGSQGVERRHGWFNARTRRITQTG